MHKAESLTDLHHIFEAFGSTVEPTNEHHINSITKRLSIVIQFVSNGSDAVERTIRQQVSVLSDALLQLSGYYSHPRVRPFESGSDRGTT